jgi:hypothetical protein
MFSEQKGEVREFCEEELIPTPGGFEVHCPGTGCWTLSLPPGVEKFEDLPRFEDNEYGSAMCYEYIVVTWPHMQP